MAIAARARKRTGLLPALLAGLAGPGAAALGRGGALRLEVVIRATLLQGKAASASDLMRLRLLLDEAALPDDQRQLVERRANAVRVAGDGLESKLGEGDYETVFAMLNGMSMEAMLKRLHTLGMAWIQPMAANTSRADRLGPASRARIEIALAAATVARLGEMGADDLQRLEARMAETELPDDQRRAVRELLPLVQPDAPACAVAIRAVGDADAQSRKPKQERPVAALVGPPLSLDLLRSSTVIAGPGGLVGPIPACAPAIVEPWLRPTSPPMEVAPFLAAPGALTMALVAGLAVFLWPRETEPPWMDALNPITDKPYRSSDEYDQVETDEPRGPDRGPAPAPRPNSAGEPGAAVIDLHEDADRSRRRRRPSRQHPRPGR